MTYPILAFTHLVASVLWLAYIMVLDGRSLTQVSSITMYVFRTCTIKLVFEVFKRIMGAKLERMLIFEKQFVWIVCNLSIIFSHFACNLFKIFSIFFVYFIEVYTKRHLYIQLGDCTTVSYNVWQIVWVNDCKCFQQDALSLSVFFVDEPPSAQWNAKWTTDRFRQL